MLSFIKRRKILLIILVAILVIAAIAWNTRGNGEKETASVSRGSLVRTVELAGKVVPREDVDLAFEVGGTAVRAFKKVGDRVIEGEVIAELDSSATRADLLKASAELEAAQAELAKFDDGESSSTKVASSRTSVVQNIVSAYTDADDAIHNKVDQFFANPKTMNPEINPSFKGFDLRERINRERVTVEDILNKWKVLAFNLTRENYSEATLREATSYMRSIMSFLDLVSIAVNSFEVNSTLTQATIDKYRSDVATARQNLNSAASTLISGEEGLTDTVSDVPVQSARMAAAQANVANYQTRLSKMVLRSPISGVVSKQDVQVGEAISANVTVISIISADYKIEAYVPEVSVAGVVPGAKAKVTFDAYGEDVVFDATVIHIDPRETIRDGVSTYKIELAFSNPDERILSGMTTNILIETMRKQNALNVPARAVVIESGRSKVWVMTAEGEFAEKEIKTGISDTNGNIEVVSGLSQSDVVLLNPEN